MHQFLEAMGKSGSGILLRLVFGIVGVKIVAVVAGPAGIGVLSRCCQSNTNQPPICQ
jgi:hypothetical protein